MIEYNEETKEVELDEKSSSRLAVNCDEREIKDETLRLIDSEPFLVKNMKNELLKQGLKAGVEKDYDFIPIEIIEDCLRLIFDNVQFEIIKSFRELDSFVCHVRIHYSYKFGNRIMFMDGIGAKYLVELRGKNHMSYDVKAHEIEKAVGVAYSNAIKSAAKKIGRLFGSKLNKEEKEFSKKGNIEMNTLLLAKLNELFMKNAYILGEEARQRIKEIILSKEEESYTKAIKSLEELY